MPAFWTSNEKFWMANKKFRTDDASCSNCWWKISNGWCQPFEWLIKNFEQMTPGIWTVEEEGSYWTTGYKWLSGWMREILILLIQDMFLRPFCKSIAVILITYFISSFKTWQNLEMDTKSFWQSKMCNNCFPSWTRVHLLPNMLKFVYHSSTHYMWPVTQLLL